jgi:SHS2 domain-containing protein
MSDALVRSYGRTLGESFANAAIGMTAVMIDLRRISPAGLERRIVVEGFDLENLLYNWLEAVLVRKDIEHEIFRESKVAIQATKNGFMLRGSLRGETVDRRRHNFKRDVKAVTYHEMSVRRSNGRYVLTFLLDL